MVKLLSNAGANCTHECLNTARAYGHEDVITFLSGGGLDEMENPTNGPQDTSQPIMCNIL